MILSKRRRSVAAAGLSLLAWASASWTAPYVPADDAAVLESLPFRASDPAQRELRALRAALAASPGNADRAIALARRYFDLAQSEGDPRYVGYAEAALRDLPETGAAAAELFVIRAQLAQYRHQFARALTLLDQALSAQPEDPEALAWGAAIRMVQADYAGAQRYCERLARVASELLGTGCLAHVAAATGKLRSAYERLLAACARHPAARLTLRLWTYTLLAEMAQRLGKAGAADAHYRAAIALGATDQYLLAAYAEFLIDEQRPAEAEALLRDWERSDVLLLLRARALRALARPEAAALAGKLQGRYAADAQRGERLHAQDEARFRLEFLADAKGAAALAAQNWAAEQREAADARVLMDAALAAGEPQLAQPVLGWLAASGYEDIRLARLAAQLQSMSRAAAR